MALCCVSVCSQFLPVCCADLAFRLAPPPKVVESLKPVVHCGQDRQLELHVSGAQRRLRPHPWFRCPGVVLEAGLAAMILAAVFSQK